MTVMTIDNWIDGKRTTPSSGIYCEKLSPATGSLQSRFASSDERDVQAAIAVAARAQPEWEKKTAVERGNILSSIQRLMNERKEELAKIVALETGKSLSDAKGETSAAIQQATFFSGEGMRSFGRTLPSGMDGKSTATIRSARGIAALIIAANTPIANVAWKLFPALICGNAVVLKAAEDTPLTAQAVAELCKEAGLPDGVFNVIQGIGETCGPSLVTHPLIDVVSFTGSTRVGREIAASAGAQLKHVSLELGGKNPFVVADDADVEHAIHWACLSAFSNAGQRCASGSRIIVMSDLYDEFKAGLVQKASSLKVGSDDNCDLGPVINHRQLQHMEERVAEMVSSGARLLCGGTRLTASPYEGGYFMPPTLLEGVEVDTPGSDIELFGPVAVLYKADSFKEAIDLANASSYGLTAAIHTRRLDRATQFTRLVRAGTINVNIGTFGSEPHFPFGGYGASGNGTREPGTEALDVYSELKVISHWVDMNSIN